MSLEIVIEGKAYKQNNFLKAANLYQQAARGYNNLVCSL